MAVAGAPVGGAGSGDPPVAGLVERPRLTELLDRGLAGKVTLITGPAGSGKSVLASTWARDAGLPVAWVDVARDEADATRFWGKVMDALRSCGAIDLADPLATVVPGPAESQDEFLLRLLEGLGRLAGPVLLVLDDLHQLRSPEAVQGLERLLEEAPTTLRTLIISRRDPQLGLHRLRLAGELAEVRGADLDFTSQEATALMAQAGLEVGDDAVDRLCERTEGWAAGLRLAAMSLARHEDPRRFVAEFAGSERTVADYLLGEVLSTLPPEVRTLLIRTCILERVNGPLADLLTGGNDGARLLAELEASNSLVVAVDVGRTWFRYHHLLADLLRLELQREAPGDIRDLHGAAATWLAENGHSLDAIRHARLAEDWDLVADLLGGTWVRLVLDGEEATLGRVLAGLPEDLVARDAEVATISAAERLHATRWEEADALIASAHRTLGELPDDRRDRAAAALALVELIRARRVGEVDEALDLATTAIVKRAREAPVHDAELEALGLMNLGIAESWSIRFADAEAHLQDGLALGRSTGSPYVQIGCLGALGVVANMTQRLRVAEEYLRQAIAVADRVGWTSQPLAAVSSMTLGAVLLDQGRLAEGEACLDRARPVLENGSEPAALLGLRHSEGMLAFARGRYDDAYECFMEGERLMRDLRRPHFLVNAERIWALRAKLLAGDDGPAREAMPDDDGQAEWGDLRARLHLLDGDPQAAADAVAPVLSGEAFALHVNMLIEGLLLDALARDQLDEPDAVFESLERALALTEPDGRVWVYLSVPGIADLLAKHPLHRTAHSAHLKTVLDNLSGAEPAPTGTHELLEPLSERELAVLRFLPTNLSAADIGSEMLVSVHTVKTHMRKLYSKLDAHTRAEAVQRGRALGLLAPAVRS
jgi:LuxR family maltose regulon positive regulatory protein